MAKFYSRTKEYSAVLILFLLSLTILQKANSLEYEMRNSDSDVDEDKVMKREEGTRTTVIRHERCLSCLNEEEREDAEESKETLEKVHTFAELEEDLRASLPPSFTVCATIFSMISNQPNQPTNPMFFTLLG